MMLNAAKIITQPDQCVIPNLFNRHETFLNFDTIWSIRNVEVARRKQD